MTIEITITDQPINFRPDGGNYPTWGLLADGRPIGTAWETENGYAGQITGTNRQGNEHQYTCPEVSSRDTVIRHLAETMERYERAGYTFPAAP